MQRLMLATLIFGLPSLALATDMAAPRYQVTAVQDGFIRLDTASGDMLFCRTINALVTCEPVGVEATGPAPDRAESPGIDDKIARLESRLTQLEQRSLKLPDEKTIDETLSRMEDFLRLLMDEAKGKDDKSAL